MNDFQVGYASVNINPELGIAIDGYYTEPITADMSEDYLLLNDNRFIITPHNAYNSKDAVFEMERMLIESLEDVLNKREIRNKVK